MVKENKLIMALEKTDTGFSAYSQKKAVFTAGSSIPELMKTPLKQWGLILDLGIKINYNTILLEINFPDGSNLLTKTRTEKNG